MKRAGITIATAAVLAAALAVGAVLAGAAPSTAGAAPSTSAVSGEITPAAGAVRASTSDDNQPGNVVDDSLETRWSGKGDGAWLELDLGAATTVSAVKLAVYNGDERRNDFELRVSSGSGWKTVYDGTSSGSTTGLQTFDIADVTTTKIRYVGHGYLPEDDDDDRGVWNSLTEVQVWGSAPTNPPTNPPTKPPTNPPGGDVPAKVLDLTNWKVTLPTGGDEKPTEIKQPALATYTNDPLFKVVGNGVQFRAPVNGVTTSGSSYPRSELREMTANGTKNAAWSSTSGTHTLVVKEAFMKLPAGKPHVVGAQIHGGDDDVTVFRLEGSKLYVTDGDNPHHKLVTGNYVLGTPFEAKFVVSGGKVRAYYNGVLQTTLSKSLSGAYFKAGAYTQANCEKSSPCSASNYGEVQIYDLKVQHS
ncbi:polysaccharide lyase family 7 protein [Kribbella sp. HUAS MG21]|uniref:Polysaccharide lyase family 7 protein n=1 Tax=Kribbella sp. HUAS MG21 TaxID=3160966 RepID=A0AAU7T8V8_9ACTN